MRFVRSCRKQSPNSCWSSDLKQIITQIVKALRSVLSWLGLSFVAPIISDKEQGSVQQSALLSDDAEKCYEGSRYQAADEGLASTLQESQVKESGKVVEVGSVAEGEADSEQSGTETPEPSVQAMQGGDNASEFRAMSEGDGRKGGISVTSGHLSGDTVEGAPTRHDLQVGVVQASTEEPPRSGTRTDAEAERGLAGSTVGAVCSDRHDETGREAPVLLTVVEGGMSGGSEHRDGSARPGDTSADDSRVDHKAVEDDALQMDEESPRSDPQPPRDVKREPTVTTTSPHAGGLTAADASADTLSTSPVGLRNEELRGRETLAEERKTVSVGVWTSDSGSVDRLQAEEEPKKPTEEGESATANDRRVPSQRQPRPPEDVHEYSVTVQDVSAVDREYARWNNAVVEQLMLAGPASEEVLLCVNPRILARVSEKAGLGSITPEEAEQQFTTSVANLYQRRVLRHGARLRVLRRCSSDGLPDCVAFLAGSVLAAFRMQSDEELSGNAYYRRLADLLKCEMQGAHPSGFDPLVFESLWEYLANWLSQTYERRLAMPKGDVGLRRFVALPLAHAPLRSLDIEKLPAFFSWAGYQPGVRARHDHIIAGLKRWQRSKNMLTQIGADALYDDRSSAVAAQASAELEAWDGGFCESTRRRSALVEIQFDVVQRSPQFFYLPRRPPGFPRVFNDGVRVFEACDEGWYDPAQLRPEDGELLESGFEWLSHDAGIDYTMRRSGASVIPLTPSSNYSGFLSSRRLLRGVRCSVLCRDNIVPTVKDYLSDVAQDLLSPVSHPLLPNGWSMFSDVSARIHVEAPAGLEALEVDEDCELIVAGGLRIGRRWSWIMGAPPRILVSGVEAQDCITVNGASVEVDANGELRASGIFAEPGEYLVEVGGLRRQITIERPQVSVQDQTERRESSEAGRRRRIALPFGSWTLIGSSPVQVCYSPGEFFRGTNASCPFHPIWAVKVGAGPGAIVAIAAAPSPPGRLSACRLTGQPRKLVQQWSNVVYAAHIRRPQFVGLNGAVPDEGIVGIWKDYVSLAKQIKRRLKKP